VLTIFLDEASSNGKPFNTKQATVRAKNNMKDTVFSYLENAGKTTPFSTIYRLDDTSKRKCNFQNCDEFCVRRNLHEETYEFILFLQLIILEITLEEYNVLFEEGLKYIKELCWKYNEEQPDTCNLIRLEQMSVELLKWNILYRTLESRTYSNKKELLIL
jgi:hypothetical protein